MTTPAPKSSIDWGSIGQLVVSSLAALLCLSLAFILALSGLVRLFSPNSVAEILFPTINMAWSQALVGVLLTLSTGLALLRLEGRPLTATPANLQSFVAKISPWLIFIWPVVLAAGYGASLLGKWGGLLLLPPLSLLATALPVFWLAAMAMRRLERSSPQRTGGILTTGLIVTPLLSTAFEIAAIFMIIILAIIWLAGHPQSLLDAQMVAQRLLNAQGNTQLLERILGSYLGRPEVYIPVLIIVAGFTPLIEEIIKPLAVWLLAGRVLTPAQGFSAGIISGAGFTLVESLSKVTSFNGSDWITVVVARAGTDLLHITTTGMMGLALAYAWHERRYLRLAVTYLLAVMLHAIWNTLGVWTGFDPYIHPLSQNQLSAVAAPIGLGTLAVIMVFILFYTNRRLRQIIL